jgi:hypothetical protein
MTVFVGRDPLIAVQGTGIEGADDVWDRVLAFRFFCRAAPVFSPPKAKSPPISAAVISSVPQSS